MKVTAYTDATVFERLANEWDGLIDTNRPETFFLRHDWLRLWWKYLPDGDLFVLSFHDDTNTLRGIVPMFVKNDVLHLLGCVDVTDYLDIIVMPGHEERVIDSFLEYLLHDCPISWSHLDFCNIPDNSPSRQYLSEVASQKGLTATSTVMEVCPVIKLPFSYEEYLAGLDKKQRHELRRKRRKGDANGIGWYVVDETHDIAEEIERFLSLMAASHPDKAAFLNEPGHRDFFRAVGPVLLKDRTLNLQFLTVEDRAVATMWQFQYGGSMLLYNSGLDPENFSHLSSGIVLLTYSIEDATSRQLGIYDFLRGNETYKYRMGAEDTQIHQIVIKR